MTPLHPRTREGLLIIQALIDRGEAPGFREIGLHLGVGTGHAARMCRNLAERGYLSIGTIFDRKITVLQRIDPPQGHIASPLPKTPQKSRKVPWTAEADELLLSARAGGNSYFKISVMIKEAYGIRASVDAIAYRFQTVHKRAKNPAKSEAQMMRHVPKHGLKCRKSFMNCGPCASICHLCINYRPPQMSIRQRRQFMGLA